MGYGEGGILTESVRRNPYSVVLLDEIEKAHPDVLELFFQVFDKGVMDDAEGREIDFKNTVFVLTSNVASSTVMQTCLNKQDEDLPDVHSLSQLIRPALIKAFKPAFLGRMQVIPYYPISDDLLLDIIEMKLELLKQRMFKGHLVNIVFENAVSENILSKCVEVDSGARNIDNVVNSTLLPQIAQITLKKLAGNDSFSSVDVTVGEDGFFKYLVH